MLFLRPVTSHLTSHLIVHIFLLYEHQNWHILLIHGDLPRRRRPADLEVTLTPGHRLQRLPGSFDNLNQYMMPFLVDDVSPTWRTPWHLANVHKKFSVFRHIWRNIWYFISFSYNQYSTGIFFTSFSTSCTHSFSLNSSAFLF